MPLRRHVVHEQRRRRPGRHERERHEQRRPDRAPVRAALPPCVLRRESGARDDQRALADPCEGSELAPEAEAIVLLRVRIEREVVVVDEPGRGQRGRRRERTNRAASEGKKSS